MNRLLPKNMLLSILFLLALPCNFLISTGDPVLDTDGHPLQVGRTYYIVPSQPGAGGGLTLELTNGRCPYEIVQDKDHADGLPVTFSPADQDDDDRHEVELDSDLNIVFTVSRGTTNSCPESRVWKLDANQQQQRPLFVTIGGSEGNPGPQTISNWFKIQKLQDHDSRSYKLQYCPSDDLCEDKCRLLCGDIGVVIDRDGRKRLAVNEAPLSVVFKTAPTP